MHWEISLTACIVHTRLASTCIVLQKRYLTENTVNVCTKIRHAPLNVDSALDSQNTLGERVCMCVYLRVRACIFVGVRGRMGATETERQI